MKKLIFPFQYPLPSSDLPCTMISLEDWVVVTVQGKDSISYLQGQLTIDVLNLKKNQHMICAHCNYLGKIWGILNIFHYENGLAYIIRRSVYKKQILELKKYATFSKVDILFNDRLYIFGIAGKNARKTLCNIFSILPEKKINLVKKDETVLLYFQYPSERFILISSMLQAQKIYKKLQPDVYLNNSIQWLLLNIEAGIPIIDFEHLETFLPQAVNLQRINGVSFKKGCYSGQEMIARAQFRNINKRSLYFLSGVTNIVPDLNALIELKINNNWRIIGKILSFVKLNSKKIWVQAIMPTVLKGNSTLRIHNDETSKLKIKNNFLICNDIKK